LRGLLHTSSAVGVCPMSQESPLLAVKQLHVCIRGLAVELPRRLLFLTPNGVLEPRQAPLFPCVIEQLPQLVWRDGGPEWRLLFSHGGAGYAVSSTVGW